MSTIDQQISGSMQQDTVYVCERSVFSAFNVFTNFSEMSHEESFMMEYIFKGYAKRNSPIGVIFIENSPERSLISAKNRGYPSDMQLTLETLKDIDERYKIWLAKTNLPVYYIHQEDIYWHTPEKILYNALQFFNHSSQI